MLFWADLRPPEGKPISGNDARARLGADGRIVRIELDTDVQELRAFLESIPPALYLGDPDRLQEYVAWGYDPRGTPPSWTNDLTEEDLGSLSQRFPLPVIGVGHSSGINRRAIDDYHEQGLAVFGLPARLGGFVPFLTDLIDRRPALIWLLDRLTEFGERQAVAIAASGVDVLYVGDDIGAPAHMLISPALWRAFLKPRLARIVSAAKSVTPTLTTCYHSDGYFSPILKDLVEIGFDAIEPSQPDCLNLSEIRRHFGGQLAFIGTIGSADLLHRGSPDTIAREVREQARLLGPTSLVLAPAYDLLPSTPWSNVESLFNAARSLH
jgi:uroporphyrinogen decarboxylase